MSDYDEELGKEVLRWYNIDFTESESSITVFFFDVKKMTVEPSVFSSWEDVLCEMLFTMEETNKDTFEEVGEHIWTDEEILYVKIIRKQKSSIIKKLLRKIGAMWRVFDGN